MSKKEKKEEKKLKEACNCDETCDCGCNEGKDCTCETCNDESCNCEECSSDCSCEEDSCSDSACEGCSGCGDANALDILKDYIKELEEKLLREKAELVNYRRRKDEEVSSLLKYSSEDIIKELLPIVDNFERAIKLDNNDLSDELSKFLDGFKMIYTLVINILNKFEVKAIDGTSIPFDPTIHQAVITEKVDGVEENMVIEILQKGYIYKDRVIRPAMVKVSI